MLARATYAIVTELSALVATGKVAAPLGQMMWPSARTSRVPEGRAAPQSVATVSRATKFSPNLTGIVDHVQSCRCSMREL